MSQHWVSLSHHMSHFRVLGSSALRASPCNLAARLMAPGTAGPQGAPRTVGSGPNGRPSWFEPHRAVTAVTGIIVSRLSRSESENDKSCGCPSMSSMSSMSMSHSVSFTPHFCSHLPQDSFLQTSGWEHARHGLSLSVFMSLWCFYVFLCPRTSAMHQNISKRKLQDVRSNTDEQTHTMHTNAFIGLSNLFQQAAQFEECLWYFLQPLRASELFQNAWTALRQIHCKPLRADFSRIE